MTNPAPLHDGVSKYAGIIHFANGYAYMELDPMSLWPLLIFDPQLSGILDLTALGQTAVTLQNIYNDGNLIKYLGVILTQSINGRMLPVLHITGLGA